ncbi:FprA family A-type flavoprotein [Thermodesulforhabdus norvegica]|uniref:Flavorubredoxin n=1 Tax=Thermodesulforhabdus norvegica TaxID=39841 RepID=A0A1I4VYU7_9BACT|nr:flavodoxin domain-containing protein [Thermodesulforhabdus norvegica]SFN06320.1 Flavorubredoxin [Thermodesulforhabdus norvegica]
MKAVEIKPGVYWVGAIDWNIRDFHGYSTYMGTTYNAFLIVDRDITLVDTVKKPFVGELLERVSQIVNPKDIRYLVVNHVEMDHSGGVPEVVSAIEPEKVICSEMGRKALLRHYHNPDWPYHVVSTGDVISIGSKELHFLETRMLHWPDSMFTYIPQDRLLISSDAFGQHWATSQRFDDEVDGEELMRHAAKYYANIILLYSPLVQKLLEKVKSLNLDIDMIAPDHGLIWRSNPRRIIEAYDRWSRQIARAKAVVVYDTMWKSTEKMAHAVAEGLMAEEIEVKLMSLKACHRSDVVTEILDAKGVAVGSPTLNNGLFPTVADLLTYLKGLKPAGKLGLAFGSYGWSGEAARIIADYLRDMKFELVQDPLRVNYVPGKDELKDCFEAGKKLGAKIKESLSS